MYIEVEDVDEFAPYWKQDMYMAEVEEGRLFNQIVKLGLFVTLGIWLKNRGKGLLLLILVLVTTWTAHNE